MESKEQAFPWEPIVRPEQVYQATKKFHNKKQEHFFVFHLNGIHAPISKPQIVAIGTVNKCQIHPRDIFREAIRRNATAIILCHNHPSGSLKPSANDDDLTRRLREAGDLLGIDILDHIIVSKNGFISYVNEGKF